MDRAREKGEKGKREIQMISHNETVELVMKWRVLMWHRMHINSFSACELLEDWKLWHENNDFPMRERYTELYLRGS